MAIIDTHTHLFSDQFDADRDQVIQNALSKGVERMYLPNIDLETVKALNLMLTEYPDNCFGMMGLHPCSVKDDYENVLFRLRKEFEATKYYAVGEIGIDLFWDKSTLGIQQEALKIQIGWAKELNLPIVLHCRDSFNEVLSIVENLHEEKLTGVFHCFTGTVEEARRVTDLGFKLGIGGVATFKNGGLDKVIPEIDLKHIVVETDSPYLAPVPYRGKRNESAYITEVVEKLATFYRKPFKEIEEATTLNALEIFHKRLYHKPLV
ncbi:MAG: TatD family hydrolase [Flavobacteriales bacterium]|nr:TatD family hydrolase [Flavobacteriales bacterium]